MTHTNICKKKKGIVKVAEDGTIKWIGELDEGLQILDGLLKDGNVVIAHMMAGENGCIWYFKIVRNKGIKDEFMEHMKRIRWHVQGNR